MVLVDILLGSCDKAHHGADLLLRDGEKVVPDCDRSAFEVGLLVEMHVHAIRSGCDLALLDDVIGQSLDPVASYVVDKNVVTRLKREVWHKLLHSRNQLTNLEVGTGVVEVARRKTLLLIFAKLIRRA